MWEGMVSVEGVWSGPRDGSRSKRGRLWQCTRTHLPPRAKVFLKPIISLDCAQVNFLGYKLVRWLSYFLQDLRFNPYITVTTNDCKHEH